MRFFGKTLTLLAGLLVLFPVFLWGSFSERYVWTFESGNLIADWSFENLSDEVCFDLPSEEVSTDCNFDSMEPYSGSHVMRVAFTDDVETDSAYSQSSREIAVKPGRFYQISFKMKADFTENIPAHPKIFWRNWDGDITSTEGNNYFDVFGGDVSGWTTFNWSVEAPDDAVGMSFALIASPLDESPGGAGDIYFFDNLVVAKAVASNRVVETRTYGDAAGQPDHSITFDGFVEIINKTERDDLGRVIKKHLPLKIGSKPIPDVYSVLVSGLDLSSDGLTVGFGYIQDAYSYLNVEVRKMHSDDLPDIITVYVVVENEGDLAPIAQQALTIRAIPSSDGVPVGLDIDGVIKGSDKYIALLGSPPPPPVMPGSSVGVFDGNIETALQAQHPDESNLASEFRYPDPGVNTFSKQSLPGAEYEIGGDHIQKSGWAILTSEDHQTIPDIPSPPELNTGETSLGAGRFMYRWSKSTQGFYSVSISDAQGRTLKSGVSKIINPTSESDYEISESMYDAFGRLEHSISPEGKTTSYQYNSSGQVTQIDDPDRGTTDILYDRAGRLRFTRSALGLQEGYFIAVKYDLQGRALGTVKVPYPAGFEQYIANDRSYPTGIKFENGLVYDELVEGEFLQRTGLNPSDIGLQLGWLENGQGKVVMAYKRNTEVVVPASVATLNTDDKLSASFFSYDKNGRLAGVFKYVGAAPDGKRWHKIKYEYDERDRLAARIVYQDETEEVVANRVFFMHDELDRVVDAIDETDPENPVPMAFYEYDFLGRLENVNLYGKLQMAYGYDIQSKTTSIEGTAPLASKPQVFGQYLGYEDKAHPQLQPALPSGLERFDGTISSKIDKYSDEAPFPVEYQTYDYSGVGRLEKSTRRREDGSALNSDGSINFTQADFPSVHQIHTYSFDQNGSILTKEVNKSGEDDVTYTYNYITGKHRLSNIAKSEGGVSATTTFSYDDDGQLTNQTGVNSKVLKYNFAGLPTKIEGGGAVFYMFYDENNYRVATLVESGGALAMRKAYVYENDLKVTKEIRQNGSEPAATLVHLYGRGGHIGVQDEATGEKRILVKDHQGSVVQVIDEETGLTMDQTFYADYGEPDKKYNSSDALNPSEGWTGKEYETQLALTYFGARFYDPEFGVWLTPDPAGQFFNPYAYGGDPINYVDPNGLWKIGLGISFGYTSSGGFSLGLGFGAEDVNLGFAKIDTYVGESYNFRNDSWTTDVTAGGGLCAGVCVQGQIGGSYNTETGYALNANAGVGLGSFQNGGGLEIGTNQYWTTGGDYIGGDVYGGVYADYMGVHGRAGYSIGFGAIESGAYASISGYGLSASYHTAYGGDWGVKQTATFYPGDIKKAWARAKVLASDDMRGFVQQGGAQYYQNGYKLWHFLRNYHAMNEIAGSVKMTGPLSSALLAKTLIAPMIFGVGVGYEASSVYNKYGWFDNQAIHNFLMDVPGDIAANAVGIGASFFHSGMAYNGGAHNWATFANRIPGPVDPFRMQF